MANAGHNANSRGSETEVDLPCYYDRPPSNVKSDPQGVETLVEPDLSSEQLNLCVKTGTSPVACYWSKM